MDQQTRSAIGLWRGPYYPNISAASRGERTTSNINKMARNMGQGFKHKYNWDKKYIYRGIRLDKSNNFRRLQGYSSWTHNIWIARSFAEQSNRPVNIILRINTNLLKGAPVINVGGPESEYILPPMNIELNRYRNGIFSPVKAVKFNQRWTAPNKPSIIPRTAARRILRRPY